MESVEISLRDLLAKAWRLRVLIVSVFLLCFLLAGLWVLKSATDVRNPVSYFVTLRNIEKSKFPNGTDFSPQDLLISQVIDAVGKRFEIPLTSNVRSYVSVDYGSPMSSGISMKYNSRLAAKGLSQADIENINEAYRSELLGGMQSSLRIDVNYSGLGVDQGTGAAIAVAIPQIWSEIYSKQFRIFVDTRIQGLAVNYSDEQLNDPASVITAKTRLDSIDGGLVLLSSDNRLASVTTQDNKSAVDILADLEHFRDVYFNPIFAESNNGGDRVSAIYVRERTLRVEDWKRRIAGLDRTLAQINEYQNSGKATAGWDSDSPARDNGGGQNVQVADSALSRIIELSDKASLADFMKTVLRQRQDMVEQISTLQKEIDLTQSSSGVEISPEFLQAAAKELSYLTAEYQALLGKARQQMLESAGDLYVPLAPPEVSGSLITARSLLVFPLLMIVAAIVSMALVLLWPERRSRPLITAIVPDMRMTTSQ